MMRVGYVQCDPVFGEVAHNLDLITARLEQVEADLLVLPELFATGYQFVSQEEVFRLAEAVPVTGGLILELLSVEGAVVRPPRRKGGKYSPRKPAQAAAKRRLVRKRR
jgi:predicted amidohydrolase